MRKIQSGNETNDWVCNTDVFWSHKTPHTGSTNSPEQAVINGNSPSTIDTKGIRTLLKVQTLKDDHPGTTEIPAVTLCVIRAAVAAGDSHIVCCTPEVETSPQEPGDINVVGP